MMMSWAVLSAPPAPPGPEPPLSILLIDIETDFQRMNSFYACSVSYMVKRCLKHSYDNN